MRGQQLILFIYHPHAYACITLFKFNSSVRPAAVSEATYRNDCCSCQVQAWVKRSGAGGGLGFGSAVCILRRSMVRASVSSHTRTRQVKS